MPGLLPGWLKFDANMSLKEKINKDRLPSHIAIIMDGNGRWAKEKGQDRLYGHFHGVESVRNIVEGCAELGVGYLTLYAFSTENWDRPEYEVTGLWNYWWIPFAKKWKHSTATTLNYT